MAPTGTPGAQATPAAAAAALAAWTHRRFFDLLATLGRLRVISIAGPSTFEALCELGPYGFAHGHMNAITRAYHWHLALDRFRHLRSCDEIHARSGRRVLFFELREAADAEPFLRIYLFRGQGEAFDPVLVERFAAAHAELRDGVALAHGEAGR